MKSIMERKENIMKVLWDLFIIFARIGGFTFGGGYAMLPMLKKEVVENKGWATEEELLDYYAIGQCTPGIIAVNTATFIGYKTKGILGGIAATFGVVAPSVLIITVITLFLQNFMEYEIVQHALAGIRVCVCVLVFDAVWSLGRKSVKGAFAIIVFVIVLALSLLVDCSPILFVLGAGVVGVIYTNILHAKGGK